ncbi:MAG: hypothetical protein HY401_06250 [Elusimicrobia bacterium]|nr:hypothetical protein [Elusimicrobiota bacterium]
MKKSSLRSFVAVAVAASFLISLPGGGFYQAWAATGPSGKSFSKSAALPQEIHSNGWVVRSLGGDGSVWAAYEETNSSLGWDALLIGHISMDAGLRTVAALNQLGLLQDEKYQAAFLRFFVDDLPKSVIGQENGDVRVANFENGTHFVLKGHQTRIVNAEIGQFVLATKDASGQMRAWNLSNGELISIRNVNGRVIYVAPYIAPGTPQSPEPYQR